MSGRSPGMPYQAAPPDPGRRKRVAMKALWASFPVWSLCVLSAVPSLVLAVRKRTDVKAWAAFAGFLTWSVVAFVLLARIPEGPDGTEQADNLTSLVFILQMPAALVHFFLNDRTTTTAAATTTTTTTTAPMTVEEVPVTPYAAPWATPTPTPTAPDRREVDRVRAEMAELNNLLRRPDSSGNRGEERR